ncbi:alanine racemase [Catenovulum sediminis]|uniref:Alanine racemase n=1 Tax=Catenovulum sediminis TaxID=1740262 RepID=A0ABV1RJS4_9ALTE|nr:alanine racemase [Catenovulum sediminis]
MKTAVAEINLSALNHNLNVVIKHCPNSKILAVCKANGYGHGIVEVATALNAANAYGVARLEEAIELRNAGITKPIVLLEGFFNTQDIALIAKHKITICLQNHWQLSQLEQAQIKPSEPLWLKVDSGMTRLGFYHHEVEQALSRLEKLNYTISETVLSSHFACADELDNPLTNSQLKRFNEILATHSKQKALQASMANSAAVLTLPEAHFDWVRPGIMLYGISPMLYSHADEYQLKPVMTLKSKLISVKKVPAGTYIGYGARWLTQAETHIGVVAIGYGDGYPRHAKDGTPVYINGRIVPLVGRVSMDMITVDLGQDCQDKVGDAVTLWGENLPIELVAENSDTIAYELVCQITQRVEKHYINQ